MKRYSPAGRRNHGRPLRDFWIRETGTGQQVAQLHDRYMMMMMNIMLHLPAKQNPVTMNYLQTADPRTQPFAPCFSG